MEHGGSGYHHCCRHTGEHAWQGSRLILKTTHQGRPPACGLGRLSGGPQDIPGEIWTRLHPAGFPEQVPERVVGIERFHDSRSKLSSQAEGSRPGQKAASGDAEESAELANPCRVAQLAQSLGLDLADALAGDLELLSDLFESASRAVNQAKALLQHLALAA